MGHCTSGTGGYKNRQFLEEFQIVKFSGLVSALGLCQSFGIFRNSKQLVRSESCRALSEFWDLPKLQATRAQRELPGSLRVLGSSLEVLEPSPLAVA